MEYELRDCVQADNGKLYCYDCEIKEVVELKITPIDTEKLPTEVVREWIHQKYKD